VTLNQVKVVAGVAYQWQAFNLHCQKGREIIEHCVRPYEASLREDMPTWSDSRGLFDRMRCKNIFDAAEIPPKMAELLDVEQGLTVDNLLNAAIEFNKNPNFPSSTFCVLERISHIISKPAIKKLLQAELDRCTLAYNNPNNTEHKPITQGFRTFVHVIDSIDWINRLWPDCPLDYYQTYLQRTPLYQTESSTYKQH